MILSSRTLTAFYRQTDSRNGKRKQNADKDSKIPVSYTHLKKQLWRDFLPGFLKDGFGGFTFEIFIKRMKPVSYTHLDVYKRQGHSPDKNQRSRDFRKRNGIVSGCIIRNIVGGTNMDYMTLKEASKKWGISSRQILLMWYNSPDFHSNPQIYSHFL